MNEQVYLGMDNVVSLLQSPSMGDHGRHDGDGSFAEVGETCASGNSANDLHTMLDVKYRNVAEDGNQR